MKPSPVCALLCAIPLLVLSQPATPTQEMQPTITSGPQFAKDANLSGSRFENVNLTQTRIHNVNLSKSEFDDINLSGTTFFDINFSDVKFSAAQFGGVQFKHIGLPPGSTEKQRPISFEECDLNSSVFEKCDLRGVEIRACQVEGMKIDGIPVQDLLEAYRRSK